MSSRDVIVLLCVEEIQKEWGRRLEGAILIGSFSRGEEIYIRKSGNILEYFSDIEFMVVLRGHPYGITTYATERRIERKLKEREIHIKVSIGVTTGDHLGKYRPSIFSVELRKHGIVAAGNNEGLDYLPSYTFDDGERIEVRGRVAAAMKHALDTAGIEIPFPQRVVDIRDAAEGSRAPSTIEGSAK